MTSARRARAVAGATLLWMLAVAAPAWAVPTLTLTSPEGSPPTFSAPGSIRGTLETEERERLRQADFSLSTKPGGEACSTDVPDDQRTLVLDNVPVADFALDVAFPCNGDYELKTIVTYDKPIAVGVSLATETYEATSRFGVAIPPNPVSGLKGSYDAAAKKVTLTWTKNPEPDVVGYRVERNPPGADGFGALGDLVSGTSVTDTLATDEEHRYRVVAVRPGPGGSEIVGSTREADIITAGPERPEPTVPDTTVVRAPPSASRGGSAAGGNRGGSAAQASRGSVTTVDNGFTKDLPFDPRQTTTVPASPSPVPPEDAAVLAIDDDRAQEDDRRATLVPIAGGLALMMGAVHLRLLSKRAAEPELPVYGSTLPR